MEREDDEDYGPHSWSVGKSACPHCNNWYYPEDYKEHVANCNMKD